MILILLDNRCFTQKDESTIQDKLGFNTIVLLVTFLKSDHSMVKRIQTSKGGD